MLCLDSCGREKKSEKERKRVKEQTERKSLLFAFFVRVVLSRLSLSTLSLTLSSLKEQTL